MINIERRTIDVNKVSFMNEVKILCRTMKKHNPGLLGIGIRNLNEHFKIRLTITDFYKLSELLELRVRRGKFWYFDEVIPEKQNV